VVKLSFFSITFRFIFYVLSSVEFLWSPLLGVCGFLSLFFGSFGGVLSTNFKEFLAYSSLAQIGFIVYGLLILDISAYASTGLFFVYYILSMLIILLVLSFFDFSVVNQEGSSIKKNQNFEKSNSWRPQIYSLNSLRYIATRPVFGAMLTVSILNLAGIPPLPGFFAKFFILMALVGYGYYFYAALCLLFSLLSVFYYVKVAMLL
jgi:NADH-quinone oxidoreductase subunit N